MLVRCLRRQEASAAWLGNSSTSQRSIAYRLRDESHNLCVPACVKDTNDRILKPMASTTMADKCEAQ